MGEITVLLRKWEEGQPDALEQLMPLVYPQLREIAAAYIRRERNPDMLQSTALVHELYLRLLGQKKISWEDRKHFLVFSARAMRMILIDHARANNAQSRGSGAVHIPLTDELPWVSVGSLELIELNRALDELNSFDPYKVQLIDLRFFLGCTAAETAKLMGTSKATVDRDVKFIKTWLYDRMYPEASNVPSVPE